VATGASAAIWDDEGMRAIYTRQVQIVGDAGALTWLLPELVEAATRVGEPDLAQDALKRVVEATAPFSTDFAAGVEARTRALVADGAAADDLYRAAIKRLGRTQLRPELARGYLMYGEWLRREHQRIAARDHLRVPTRCSCRSGWRLSPSAPVANCSPRARESPQAFAGGLVSR
jgi:hypothetical protein